MPFSVELYDRTFTAAAPPTILQLAPQRYGAEAVGGYKDAEIAISGPVEALWEAIRWLRYYVIIRNDRKNIVWAGIVTEAQINLGGLTRGKTLDNMANRIAVAYSYTDPAGNSASGKTTYSSLAESTSRYGTKELVQSQGDSDATQAAQLRDTALAIIGSPPNTPSAAGSGEVGGTLHCKGLWWTNSWRIYNQLGGVEQYTDTGSFEHLLGWGQASTFIGFRSHKIHDLGGALTNLRADDQIVVSGAVNGGNNGTFTITEAANHDAYYYHPTTGVIFWQPTDDVFDNLSGLGFVQADEMLYISSTPGAYAGNLGYMFAKSNVGAYAITVLQPAAPNTIVHDGPTAGQDVQIKQGHSITVSGSLTTEVPTGTVTMAGLGVAVGQSFTLSVNSPFTVAEVYVRLKKVGTPVDNVYVSLQADSGGSPSNVSIETIAVTGSTLTEDMNWVTFTFSNANTLSYGVTYWLVVGRTGANSTTDYYILDINEDSTYAGGTCKLWNGSAWVARSWGTPAKTGDVPFQIWGHQQTAATANGSSQIFDMLTYANTNNFFSALDIQDSTSRFTRQYRDQDQNCQQEVEKLMKAGTSANTRLLASVTPDRVCHVYKEPSYALSRPLLLGNDMSLRDASGQPLEPGRLPVGQWADLTGVPVGIDQLVGMQHEFIESAEYDVQSGKLSTLNFKGAVDPWDVMRLV